MNTMSQSMFTFRNIVTTPLQLLAMYYICQAAYNIRMYAINTYGLVIHEFDPWFNFRATQYLADHGLSSFFKWYDYMSWSPLGRPVGTTIYPGMQMVSVFIWKVLNEVIGYEMSLNDVCCYVPVWFGVLATILVGAMTYVVTGGSRNKAVVASAVMSIIPAHIMRSVGGGYDNESVAISCLCLTFTCWCWAVSGVSNNNNDVADAMVANDPSASPPRKAARTGSTASYIFCGILTGLAYVCMVAAWGGYIFVLNMIGVHAVALVFMGRYSPQLYWTYTFWYIIGTAGAMQVPVVGWTPLKSLEQLGPCGVFIMLQMIALATSEPVIKAMGYSTVDIPASADGKQKEVKKITKMQQFTIVMQMFVLAGIVLGIVVGILWPTGYFGPLSSRVRGLFVRHTRTGNPLVDSVAEHQPASPQAYWQFLHLTCYVAPVGYAFAFLIGVVQPFLRSFQFNVKSADKKKDKSKTSVSLPKAESWTNTDPMFFVVLCATITYHFSNKMNRLMLLMGPVCSILTGIAIGGGLDMLENEVGDLAVMIINGVDLEDVDATESSDNKSPSKSKSKESKDTVTYFEGNVYSWLMVKLTSAYNYIVIRIIRKVVLAYALFTVLQYSPAFYQYSQEMAVNMSNPSIMFQARLQDGTTIMVDDYREAYWWLRDNTPEDARVMAWWDYGYQITGIGNRTTIADGNTWNHEVSGLSCLHM